MKLLELRFYPLGKNQHRFKVSVEGKGGEVHHEPLLPFPKSKTSDKTNKGFTVVKILELAEFVASNFSEAEQAWMVREKLLLKDRSAFHPQCLSNIGRKLYQVLGQNIQQAIESAVGDAKSDRTDLHIRLRFPAHDPQNVRLTEYPWELLCNEYGFLVRQGVVFSRYIAHRSPCPNLPSTDALNVLLIASGASDERMGLEPLLSSEQEAIALGLQNARETIQLETLASPTLKQLRQRLLENRHSLPQILHFDGHGFFGKRCHQQRCRTAYKQAATRCDVCGAPLGEAQGYLVLEKSNGNADYVSAEELGELLGNVGRGQQSNSTGIALVILSSCRSGMSRLSESVFNGVAQNLIGRGIPAVVAMTYSIEVSAAQDFVETFYRAVAAGESIALALRQGQSAMGIEGNQWYCPVLYLRWEDNEGGQLFKAAPVKSDPVETQPNLTVQSPPIQLLPVNSENEYYKKRLADNPPISDKPPIKSNPFDIPAGPIANPNSFFGREELLRQIFEELAKGGNLSIVGPEKVGKSSVLSMICQLGPKRFKLPSENFINIDMQIIRDENEFFEALCDELGIENCRGYKLARALRGKHYIVCLDEIDKLTRQEHFSGDERTELCGFADGADKPFSLVIASQKSLDELFPDSPYRRSPLASLCRPILKVEPFLPEESRAFLNCRLQGTNVSFSESEIAALHTESNGYPGHLQRAAAELYRRRTQVSE